MGNRSTFVVGMLLASVCMAPSPVQSQEKSIDFNLPAQPLAVSLREVALRSGESVIAPSNLVRRRRAPALIGRFSVEAAIASLIAGSGLKVSLIGSSLVVLQDEQAGAVAASEQDVVVTGTRIRGTEAAGSHVVTLDRAAVERSGYATTAELLQSLPQNYGGGPNQATAGISSRDDSGLNTGYGSSINLRGLGPSSTLVLLNGNRPALGGLTGVFADLSLIPATAIERVEVLADGSSAIYGSDAVAGVVNVIPRQHFTGAETSARVGTADGDRTDVQFSQLIGHKWSGGHFTLAYEFYDVDRLPANSRRYASEDLRAFGGPDLRQAYAAPGNISAGGQSFAIPPLQDGRRLTRSQLLAGQTNLQDQWASADILPTQRRHSLYGFVEQRVTDRVTLYAEGLFGDRRYEERELPTNVDVPRTVTASNPFYVNVLGTGAPITVRYDLSRDLGPSTAEGHVQGWGLSGGSRIALGRWSSDVHLSLGQQYERSQVINLVNTVRLAAALLDPDPRTSYDLFGDGTSTNPATIASVRGSTETRSRYRLWSASVKADGPLIMIPAGEVRLAVGSEIRKERIASLPAISDTVTAAPVPDTVLGLPGPRRILAGYAELAIPLASPGLNLPGIRQLDLSVAARVENYNDFGTTTNPKVGLRWQPFHGVTLRGSYGTSFRAPSFDNLRVSPQNTLIFSIALADPTAPSGQRSVVVRRGNNSDIGPERATTWTAGADIEPSFVPGLRLSATWFDILYKDRIASPSAELYNFLTQPDRFAGITTRNPSQATIAQLYADPAFRNFFGIPASAITAVIDARTQNLSVERENGLDIAALYRFGIAGGTAAVGVDASWLAKLEQGLTATAPRVDVRNTLGNPVDWRWRASANYARGRLSLASFVNHVGDYQNQTVVPAQHVRSWTTVDASIGYRFDAGKRPFKNLRLDLSATNLLDRSPPYVLNNNGIFAVGYNPDLSDPVGRAVSLRATTTW